MKSALAIKSRTPSSLTTSFPHVLHENGPDPERKTKLGLYAWLVGRWEMDVSTILEDGSTHAGRGEIHAGWVLEGRAIQDVWMIPRLNERRPEIEQLPGAGNWYGTTLRIYDPNLDTWRIQWNDPATNFFTQQTGRARGRDIVQEGPDPRGGSRGGLFPKSSRRLFIGQRNEVRTTRTGEGSRYPCAPHVSGVQCLRRSNDRMMHHALLQSRCRLRFSCPPAR